MFHSDITGLGRMLGNPIISRTVIRQRTLAKRNTIHQAPTHLGSSLSKGYLGKCTMGNLKPAVNARGHYSNCMGCRILRIIHSFHMHDFKRMRQFNNVGIYRYYFNEGR